MRSFLIRARNVFVAISSVWKDSFLRKQPLGVALKVTARLTFILVFPSTLYAIFGISDYIFFANHYRKIQVVNPVFVVSTARSGSTAFHETLSKDKQFITPSMWEVTFPYVSAFYFFKFLGYLDDKLNGSKLQNAISSLKASEEFYERHPANLYSPDQDDSYLFHNFAIGEYTYNFFATPKATKYAQWNNLSKKEQEGIAQSFYEFVQKLIYFHGEEKIFLSKSHGIYWIETFDKYFKNASYIVNIRNPIDSLPSHITFVSVGNRMLYDIDVILQNPEYRNQAIQFRKDYLDKELEVFFDTRGKLPSGSDAKLKVIPVYYHDYISNIKQTIETIYQQLGLQLSPRYSTYLEQRTEEQRSHKEHRKNPTFLPSLGYSKEQFESDFGNYIQYHFPEGK